MQTRRRIAQGLVILGSAVLFLSAAFHGLLAYPQIVNAITGKVADPFVVGALKSIWLIVSWHWIVIGVIALVASFGPFAPRKVILSLCGLAAIVDAVAAFVGVGLFAGDASLTVAGIAILAGAALFPTDGGPRA
jgi:hypothetical protein